MERRASVALLLGGFDPPDRAEAIAAGRRPANDVEMLVREFGATVYDFGWLTRSAARSHRALVWLAARTGWWSAALAIGAAGRVRSADVVYVSGEDVGVFAALAARALPGPRPRYVVRVERHRYGRTPRRRRVHRTAMRAALRAVDVAVCRTAAVAERLRDDASPGTRVEVFGQEIDVAFFDPQARATDPVAPPIDGPYLLTAGLERRDIDTLLDAYGLIERRLGVECPRLVIAAGSPWSKDAFATTRELPAGVTVGSFGPLEMRELYREALVVVLSVLPTERACGMNVVGEAWAMGRPVIASATDGLREYVIDEVSGRLVAPGDARALADVLVDLLGRPDDRGRLGTGGRAQVVDSLSLGVFTTTIGGFLGVEPGSRDLIVMQLRSL